MNPMFFIATLRADPTVGGFLLKAIAFYKESDADAFQMQFNLIEFPCESNFCHGNLEGRPKGFLLKAIAFYKEFDADTFFKYNAVNRVSL